VANGDLDHINASGDIAISDAIRVQDGFIATGIQVGGNLNASIYVPNGQIASISAGNGFQFTNVQAQVIQSLRVTGNLGGQVQYGVLSNYGDIFAESIGSISATGGNIMAVRIRTEGGGIETISATKTGAGTGNLYSAISTLGGDIGTIMAYSITGDITARRKRGDDFITGLATSIGGNIGTIFSSSPLNNIIHATGYIEEVSMGIDGTNITSRVTIEAQGGAKFDGGFNAQGLANEPQALWVQISSGGAFFGKVDLGYWQALVPRDLRAVFANDPNNGLRKELVVFQIGQSLKTFVASSSTNDDVNLKRAQFIWGGTGAPGQNQDANNVTGIVVNTKNAELGPIFTDTDSDDLNTDYSVEAP
jgi:hypothetical protein